jgi:hypothetical protein
MDLVTGCEGPQNRYSHKFFRAFAPLDKRRAPPERGRRLSCWARMAIARRQSLFDFAFLPRIESRRLIR